LDRSNNSEQLQLNKDRLNNSPTKLEEFSSSFNEEGKIAIAQQDYVAQKYE